MLTEDKIKVGMGLNTATSMEFVWSEPMAPKQARQQLRTLRALTDNHTPMEKPGHLLLIPDEFVRSVNHYAKDFEYNPNFSFPKL